MKIIKYKPHPEFNRLKMMGFRGIFGLIGWAIFSIFTLVLLVPQEYGFISSKGLSVILCFFLPWVLFLRVLFPRRKWLWKTFLAVLLAYTLIVVLFRKPEKQKEDPSDKYKSLAYYKPEHHTPGLIAVSGAGLGDSVNHKWGLIDYNGNIVVPPKYDRLTDFCEGLMAVKSDSLWGFINQHGEEVIPPQYTEANKFSYGRAAVKSGGKWGYIDLSGETVIPFLYDTATSFDYGRATVTLNGELLRIDLSGTPID